MTVMCANMQANRLPQRKCNSLGYYKQRGARGE